jgi:oligogalacturonide lyase
MKPPLKHCLFLLFVLLAQRAFAAGAPAPAAEPPVEWIDPATGHRVLRLSREPGSASLYFHQNAYSPDGKKLIITTPTGISTITLATRAIESVVEGSVRAIMVGRKTGDVYYTKPVAKETAKPDGTRETVNQTWIYATNLNTKVTREIAPLPRGGVASINADETLMLGQYTEGDEGRGPGRPAGTPGTSSSTAASGQPAAAGANPTFQAGYKANWPDGRPMAYAEAKDLALHNRLMAIRQGPPQVIFTVNIQTGEVKEILKQREWLGHLQFSPTDPTLIMFCHEGTWHEVDRIWTVHTDGTGLTKMHTRTMNMEIAGHEFFAADGRMIWYDLQTPRGQDFWLGGYELATGKRTWYHLQRNEWSVHYNVSPDGRLFAGDGGDSEMVAHAPDGKWIYLFNPERVPDVAGIKNPGSDSLIDIGVFNAERLVNLSSHNYQLEPNVGFTPDMKWIVFRSNLHGPTHVYAVEIAKH